MPSLIYPESRGFEIVDDVLYIRPSTVDSAMLCGGRAGLKGTEGFRYTPNEGLLFGSTVHWWIETWLVGGKEPTIDELLGQLDELYVKDMPDQFTDRIVPSEFLSNRARLEFVAEVAEAGEKWVEKVYPKLLVGRDTSQYHIEERVEAECGTIVGMTGELLVVLRGPPDLVDPDNELIVDWKTAGRAWDPKRLEKQFQVVVYPRMVEATTGVEISTFVYWIYDRNGEWWVPLETTVGTDTEWEAAAEQACRVASSLLWGSWTYRPQGQGHKTRGWHCSPKYCDAWGICPGKHLVRDGRANEPTMVGKESWS